MFPWRSPPLNPFLVLSNDYVKVLRLVLFWLNERDINPNEEGVLGTGGLLDVEDEGS